MDVQPGATADLSVTVTADLTAAAMGNVGVDVYATPHLVCLLEDVAAAVIKPHLPPGAGTVGTYVEMRHLAATPVGMTVRARATLLQTDGRRFMFKVEAWDDIEKVTEGRHERYLVADIATFMARAMRKGRT